MRRLFSSPRHQQLAALTLLVTATTSLFGIMLGWLAATSAIYVVGALVAVFSLVYFFQSFEQAAIGLLIIRSSLDIFSDQGVPALFSIWLDVLILLYVVINIVKGKEISTDRFWWFLLGWVLIQSLWVILLPLGALGSDVSALGTSLREWVRLFSWSLVYLMVLQLRGKVDPERIVNLLFISLILPISAAFVQVVVPESLLPSFLMLVDSNSELASASRINGTFGHPNSFTTFLVLFIGLTCWKIEHCRQRWPWLLLLSVLIFFVVSTKSLVGLPMTAIVVFVFNFPRLTLVRFVSATVLGAAVLGLFASSEFGRSRLASLADTPLLNPDIDISRAILMRQFVNNSFNWRIDQWTSLLRAWEESPILGFGLKTSRSLTHLRNAPHNDYIRALVESGLVGLALFLLFLGVALCRLIHLYRSLSKGTAQSDLCLVLLGILLSMMMGMLTDNIFSHTTLFFYWLSLSSIVGWNWCNQEQVSSQAIRASATL